MPNQSSKIFSRESPFGGVPQRNPNRKVLINAKDFQDVEQGNPIPLFYGTNRTSGIVITPVFGIKSKGSSQGK